MPAGRTQCRGPCALHRRAVMKKQVVIFGGGFGGLRAAPGLKSVPVDVTLIDRRNYSPFPAAFVPGRHRLSLARRHRRAPAQRLQPPEERTRAARGGRRRRSRIEADHARGRCRISVRRADRRRRFTELVLRARRLAAVGAQLEERGRGDQHPAQDPALEEEVPGSNDYAQARILPAAFWISTPLPSSKTITARVHGPMAICVSGCASNERETSR